MEPSTTRRRQIGRPNLVFAIACVITAVALVAVGGEAAIAGAVFFLVAVLIGWTSVLTVSCAPDAVDVRFVGGWPRRRIEPSTIRRVETVRNKAWWGLGIRKIPGGWMYNVWGLDAVEVDYLESGGTMKRFRIGTDAPTDLAADIRSVSPIR